MARGRRGKEVIEGFKNIVINSFVELFGKKDADDEDVTPEGKQSKAARKAAFLKMIKKKKKGK